MAADSEGSGLTGSGAGLRESGSSSAGFRMGLGFRVGDLGFRV